MGQTWGLRADLSGATARSVPAEHLIHCHCVLFQRKWGGGLWGSDWPKSPVSLQQTLPSPQSYTALSPSEMALTSQPETTENWPLRALSLWGTTAFSEPQPIQPHSGSAPDGTEGPLQERFTEISL